MKIENTQINMRAINFDKHSFIEFSNNQKSNQTINDMIDKESIRIEISKAGENFYNYQEDSENPKIFDDMLKVLKAATDDPIAAYQEYIDETVYNKAIALKEGTIKIMEMNSSATEKEEKLDILNIQYERTIESASKRISRIFDEYFDSGTSLLNQYSEETVDEIFNETVFKNHISYLSMTAKQMVFEKDNIPNASDLKKEIENRSSNSDSLEKMSIHDMKEVIKFVYQVEEVTGTTVESEKSIGEVVANRENSRVALIEELSISQSTKEGILSAEKRQSEGMLRHFSYQEEMKKNGVKILEYTDFLRRLAQRLKKVQKRITLIKERLGVFSNNDKLLKLLQSEKRIGNQFKKIAEDKEKIEEEVKALENNKSSIIEKDTYKKHKSIYDKKVSSKSENVIKNKNISTKFF